MRAFHYVALRGFRSKSDVGIGQRMATETRDIEGRRLEITHPDKLMFPEADIDKRAVVDYYARIAAVMIPHMRGRPITLERYTEGIAGDGFYHKDVAGSVPDWVSTVDVETTDGDTVTQIVCDDAATLVYIAQLDCTTPHAWLSRVGRLDRPDRVMLDLDPSTDDVDAVRFAAGCVIDLVERIGLVPFVQTTGSRGYHVVVPIHAENDFETVRDFARTLAELAVDREPARLTTEQRKDRRGGRVFVDYLRNAYGQTAVSPYAIRALPGAPVATPLDLDEIATTDPQAYRVDNVFRRLAQKTDPWAEIDSDARSLRPARDALSRL